MDKVILILFLSAATATATRAATASATRAATVTATRTLSVKSQPRELKVPFPLGVLSCKLKCSRIGGCRTFGYVHENLNCTLRIGSTKTSRIPKNDCSLKGCPSWYECIQKKAGKTVCVGLGAKSPRPSATHFKDLEGLLTLSGGRSKKLNFLNFERNKWFTIHEFRAGKVTALKSYGTNIYWCQTREDKCCHFMAAKEKNRYVASSISLKAVDIAVDEEVGTIFLALSNKQVRWLSKSWQFEVKTLWFLRITPKNIEVGGRLLFVSFVKTKYIHCYNYEGRPVQVFHFNDDCQHLSFDPLGDVLYISMVNHTIGIVRHPEPMLFKKEVKSITGVTEDLHIMAFTDRLILVREKSVVQMDKEGNMLPGKRRFTIPDIKFTRPNPIAIAMIPTSNSEIVVLKKRSHINHLVSSTAVLKPNPRAENVLVVTRHVTYSTVTSKLHTLDLSSGELKASGQFEGEVASLEVVGHVLYRCQRKPTGVYIAGFTDFMLHTDTEKTISGGPCTTVAADSDKKMVFYDLFTKLKRYSLISHSNTVLPMVKMGSGATIVTDKLYHAIFIFRRGKETIKRYTYHGKLQHTYTTIHAIFDLVLHSHVQMVFFTHKKQTNELLTGDITRNPKHKTLKVKKVIFEKPITAFGLTKTDLVLVNNQTYKKYMISTLNQIKDDGGQFNFSSNFNIKLFSIGEL